jgi:hypothetical protein
MLEVPTFTREGTSLLGKETAEICGIPRWMTVGRDDYTKFLSALPRDDEGAFHPSVVPGESRQDTFFDFENFKYEDPIFGLDEATGYQLHQWSVEELLSTGILTGDKHNPESIRFNPDISPLVRRTTIGEPGAKSRVVTVGEACLTIFLQPFSHHIGGRLKAHPSAYAGFTRSAQAFEYVKAIHVKEHPDTDQLDLWMLSSDLTTATDFCQHGYSQSMLDGLFDGLGENFPYHRLSSQLLCSPRVVIDSLDGNWVTKRGILMGDPGAKCVLTMHNLCAELESLLRYRWGKVSDSEILERTRRMTEIPSAWWRHFACSGDDHVATGPVEYLQGITNSHSRNGLSVSWPQNFVSKIGAVYCEDFLYIRGYSSKEIFCKKYLWQLEYGSHIHVDAIKLRLLSPCSKEHEGKDEPNPGIGKAHQISKVLAWLEPPVDLLKKWASWRFSDRFSAHLPKDVSRYLPVSLGGLSAPGWHLEPENLVDEIINLSDEHLHLIDKVLSGSSTHMDRRVLSSFASDARARGVSQDAINDHVRDLLSNLELVKSINVEQIQSVIDIEADEFKNWTIRKKLSAAQAAGFISINDAINLIERPYIFRDLLFPDMSEKHGYQPRASSAYEAKSWHIRKRKFNEMLDIQVPAGEVSPPSAEVTWSIAMAISSGTLLEVPPSNLLIPREVVELESRPRLLTPY